MGEVVNVVVMVDTDWVRRWCGWWCGVSCVGVERVREGSGWGDGAVVERGGRTVWVTPRDERDVDVVPDRAGRERAGDAVGARGVERSERSGVDAAGAVVVRADGDRRAGRAGRSSAVPAARWSGRRMRRRGSRGRTCTGRRPGTRSRSLRRPRGMRRRGIAWRRDEKPAYAGGHQADGVAIGADWVELIEVELTAKRMPRYASIFQAFRNRFDSGDMSRSPTSATPRAPGPFGRR